MAALRSSGGVCVEKAGGLVVSNPHCRSSTGRYRDAPSQPSPGWAAPYTSRCYQPVNKKQQPQQQQHNNNTNTTQHNNNTNKRQQQTTPTTTATTATPTTTTTTPTTPTTTTTIKHTSDRLYCIFFPLAELQQSSKYNSKLITKTCVAKSHPSNRQKNCESC
ncbi:unnamed protein product [Polarella glacialis]|uniref:Uncharacterized protein n=1 Tax=Polarella glacialis TaxID=89957 RepID=A0A813GAS9_POLGL|nr:unnamed protein product [Polarella glacialis]